MTTGSGSSGRRHAAGSSDADVMAEVFNRFTLSSGRGRRQAAVAEPSEPGQDASWPVEEPVEVEEPPEPEEPVEAREPGEPRHAGAEESSTCIRPYAWTGGRTRSSQRLELETLVSTSEMCRSAMVQRLEHHSIAELCRHPRSVAEVGAMLAVPLGVARVLLGDMADLGLITVHRTVTENGSTSHLMLMERVLKGLRRL
ncbi:DUF742 domain-containing protein [Saccharopolyspora taberi]|uniref:DUF742 domain-containing protein n=1 Tax=Saccharopolyspora taberi TaxID=60895 RepID=A0ABN3VDL1_9PSEU